MTNTTQSIPSDFEVLREIRPRSEHIVHAFDYWFHMNKPRVSFRTVIKLEKCDGTLQAYVEDLKRKDLSMNLLNLCEIMIQVLTGVCHIHDHRICHRDLKESNGFPH